MPISTRVYRAIDSITGGKYWLFTSAIVLTALALFFAFPSYNDIVTKEWDALFAKAANPFANSTYGAGTHEAKITFRLLVPLILHYTHLGIAGTLMFLGIIGVLNFYIVVRLAFDMLQDKRQAFMLGLCSAFMYFGKCSFIELRGTMFDGIAIFLLLCAMNFRRPLLITLFVFFAAWCDERALVGSTLVWLYYMLQQQQGSIIQKSFSRHTISVYAAWVAYTVVRYLLVRNYGLTTSMEGVGLSVLLNQINNIPMGIWSALEGLWIPVLYAGILLYRNKRYFEMLKYAGICCIILLAGLMVVDITRSVVYLFPVVFSAFTVLQRYVTKEKLNQLLWFALILCFVYPAYYTGGKSSIWWTYPLPLQMLRFI